RRRRLPVQAVRDRRAARAYPRDVAARETRGAGSYRVALRRTRDRSRAASGQARRRTDPRDSDGVRAARGDGDEPGEAADAPVVAAPRVGERLRRREPLFEDLRAAAAPEAGRRRSGADLRGDGTWCRIPVDLRA